MKQKIFSLDIQQRLNKLFNELFCTKEFLVNNDFLTNIEDSLIMGFIMIAKNDVYMNRLTKEFIKETSIEIDLKDVQDYVYHSKVLSTMFANAVKKFYKENLYKEVDYLLDLDDKKGEITTTKKISFDYFSRDKAFMFIDNITYIGEPEETHNDMVIRYFNKINKSQLRPEESTIGKKVVFGHLIKDVAFIDASESINPKDISFKLKNDLQAKKVYLIPLENESKLVKLE